MSWTGVSVAGTWGRAPCAASDRARLAMTPHARYRRAAHASRATRWSDDARNAENGAESLTLPAPSPCWALVPHAASRPDRRTADSLSEAEESGRGGVRRDGEGRNDRRPHHLHESRRR